MKKVVDEMISSVPYRITYLKVEPSKLKIRNLHVLQFGHIPGKIIKQKSFSYSYWSMTYIACGGGTYQVDNGPIHALKAGDVYWEWPGSQFDFGPDEKGWDEYYISFEGNRVQEWLESGLIRPGEILNVGTNSHWAVKFDAIGKLIASGLSQNADRAALLLESLIYEVNQLQDTNDAGQLKQKPALLARVLEDISSSLYSAWNEKQVWERNHISRSTLRRLIYDHTGYSLNEYVHRLKIDEAKKLLTFTNLQVQEIADQLGFSDPAYFSRLFKKYAGISAVKYRSANIR